MGEEPKAPPHRLAVTVAVVLASVLQTLDTTIANISLPHIRGNLSATAEQMGWVLTSYIIAAAIMTPLAGWLAGRFGNKRVLVFSIVAFTLGSALCGMSQSIYQLVLFRTLQGLGGAALVPLSQAVLLDINPPERHGRATAIWSVGVLLGPISGPLLGGWITENYSWRWVFYINVPMGIFSLIGVLGYLRESRTRHSKFDFLGFAALSVAIGALQLVLDRGGLLDWFESGEIRLEAFVGAIALYFFVVHTATARQPFVSPALFKDRNFLSGNSFMFVSGSVLFATLALLPPVLQDLLGYPATTAGLATSPRGLGALVTMSLCAWLIGRVDSRLLIGLGFGLVASSLVLLSHLSLQVDVYPLLWSGFLQGFGSGLIYVPVAAVSFATLPAYLRSEGTAIFSLCRNLGSSTGIACMQALWTHNTQVMHARLAEDITAYGGRLRPAAHYYASGAHGLAALNALVTRQAQMVSYNNDFKLMLVLTIGILPMLLLVKDRRRAAGGGPPAVEIE